MAQLITIKLSKTQGQSWGFRLQGGKDFATPLCIQKVNAGSIAANAGVQAGDAIVSIGNSDALSLRHKEAQDCIVRAGGHFDLVIQRGASLWKPQTTALPEPVATSQGPVATKTSLKAGRQDSAPIGAKFNAAPAPFGEVNGVPIVPSAYNSPINIYSDANIAETLSAQAEVLGKGVLGVNFMKNKRDYDGGSSDVLRMVQEMDNEPPPPSEDDVDSPGNVDVHSGFGLHSHEKIAQGSSFKMLQAALVPCPSSPASPPTSKPKPTFSSVSAPKTDPTKPTGDQLKPGENICSECSRLIIGVFVRIKDKNLHAECFKCATCGTTLKNVGYYNINEKLYCDVHAKQAAKVNAPAPNMVPVTVKPGGAVPTGALTSMQARSKQQPAPSFQAPPPAPAPIVAPSKPAPAPAPAPVFAPPKPVQNFGAPSGDFNFKTQVPKRDSQFAWPPNRDGVQEEEEPHTPAWAPAGNIPSVLKPMKPDGPLPKHVPLLPTPPPPKDFDTLVMKSQIKSLPVTETPVKPTIPKPLPPRPISDPTPIVPDPLSSQFRNPAPSFLFKTNQYPTRAASEVLRSRSSGNLSAGAAGAGSGLSADDDNMHDPNAVKAKSTPPASEVDMGVGFMPAPAPYKCNLARLNISPPKPVPITEPMPTVNWNTKPSGGALSFKTAPSVSSSEAEKPKVKVVSAPKEAPKKSTQADLGFKAVKSPALGGSVSSKPLKSASGPGPKLPDNPAPVVLPTPAASSVLTPPPCVAKTAPVPAAVKSQGPKPGPSKPTASTGTDAPIEPIMAPKQAPAPVQSFMPNVAPAPAPSFMPKPGGMGGAGPGGPVRGVPMAPGHRTAPRRGRGIMTQSGGARIPICGNCKRQIRGPFVNALGKTWCPDHFVCNTESCRKPLIEMGFVEEQGALHCEDCYEKYLAPICGKCDRRVKGDCLNAVGKQFHPECFCCAYCGKVFGSGAFYLEDGLPYCETDWNDLFTTKCVGCNFPIEAGDRWVEALNNNYHSQCFKCSKCQKNLEGQSFFAKGGKPFCKAHAQRGF